MISMLLSLLVLIGPNGSFAIECEQYVENAPSIAPDDRLTELAIQIFRRAVLYEAYSRLDEFNGWIPDLYHEYFGSHRSSAPVVSIRETAASEKVTSKQMLEIQRWLRNSAIDAHALGEREFTRSVLATVNAGNRRYEGRSDFHRNEAVVAIDVTDLDDNVRHFALRFAYSVHDFDLVFERSLATGIAPVLNEVREPAQWADGYSSFINHQLIPLRPVFRVQGDSNALPFDEIIIDSMPSQLKGFVPPTASFHLMKQGRSISGDTFQFERMNNDDVALQFTTVKNQNFWRANEYVFTVNLANNTLAVQERTAYPLIGGLTRSRPVLFKKID